MQVMVSCEQLQSVIDRLSMKMTLKTIVLRTSCDFPLKLKSGFFL